MINKVILKGNVGKKPHISLDQRGREIAAFSLASNTTWRDGSGEWHQHTDWHQVIVFRDSTVRWIKDFLQKGDTIYLEGKLTSHRWTDKYNQVRTDVAIIIAGNEGKIEYLRSKNPPCVLDTEKQANLLHSLEESPAPLLKQEKETT